MPAPLPLAHRAPTRFAGPLVGLFLSGAAGLIDQVCWIRRSSLVFGSTTQALGAVLAVFFLGLALGSGTFGLIAQRARHPLRTCALVELGLAALVLATLPAFAALEGAYGGAYRAFPGDSFALWAARAGLVAIVLLPPTFLMGATLPLFSRLRVLDPRRMGHAIAEIYALNTLGAACGCALAGFVLLPAIGMSGCLTLAAGFNLVAAGLMFTARAATADAPAAQPAGTAARASVVAIVGTLVFVTGFVALGEEVLWTRFLALIVHNSIRTYALTLTLVLAGIVIGSGLVGGLADRTRDPARPFGGFQLASGVLVWLLFLLPPGWWRALGGELPAGALLLLPATVLSGASFPLAVRAVLAAPSLAGIGMGTLLASSTLGGIAGALATGFVLLPRLGLEPAARICTALSLACGAGAWLWLGRREGMRRKLIITAAALVAWFALPVLTRTRLPADFLADRARLLDYREGMESNLAVVRGASGERVLEIDRWWQGQDVKTHQIMAAHLPMMLHRAPRRVLVVGVGAGQTPSRFAMYPLDRLDCVDIEPRVFDLVRAHFDAGWMRDPRVRLVTMDGRNHVANTGERYDLISLEVGQLSRPGVASFYTLDFYRRASERLAPGGIVSQFVALPFLNPNDLRSVIATFKAVFPHATLWYNTSELLLVGSQDSLPVMRRERWAQVMADSTIAADVRFSPWGGPREWLDTREHVAASFLCGSTGLATLANGGEIYRDDRPRLDYSASARSEGSTGELDVLPIVRGSLDPIEDGSPDLDGVSARAADTLRQANIHDMQAAVYVRGVEAARDRGDIAGAAAMLHSALAANPGNLVANRFMGDASVRLGRTDEAMRYYRLALAISDQDAGAHAGLGFLALRAGHFSQAAEHLKTALANGPDNAELRNNLGAALGQLGDLPGALEQFERAAALDPADLSARQNVALVRAAIARGAQPMSP